MSDTPVDLDALYERMCRIARIGEPRVWDDGFRLSELSVVITELRAARVKIAELTRERDAQLDRATLAWREVVARTAELITARQRIAELTQLARNESLAVNKVCAQRDEARARVAEMQKPAVPPEAIADEARTDRDMWKANALRMEKERDTARVRATMLEGERNEQWDKRKKAESRCLEMVRVEELEERIKDYAQSWATAIDQRDAATFEVVDIRKALLALAESATNEITSLRARVVQLELEAAISAPTFSRRELEAQLTTTRTRVAELEDAAAGHECGPWWRPDAAELATARVVVKACHDWVTDDGTCHFCSYGNRDGPVHDESCPLAAYDAAVKT